MILVSVDGAQCELPDDAALTLQSAGGDIVRLPVRALVQEGHLEDEEVRCARLARFIVQNEGVPTDPLVLQVPLPDGSLRSVTTDEMLVFVQLMVELAAPPTNEQRVTGLPDDVRTLLRPAVRTEAPDWAAPGTARPPFTQDIDPIPESPIEDAVVGRRIWADLSWLVALVELCSFYEFGLGAEYAAVEHAMVVACRYVDYGQETLGLTDDDIFRISGIAAPEHSMDAPTLARMLRVHPAVAIELLGAAALAEILGVDAAAAAVLIEAREDLARALRDNDGAELGVSAEALGRLRTRIANDALDEASRLIGDPVALRARLLADAERAHEWAFPK